MIIIKDLSKAYGNRQVLKNVNISFEQGKVYGIVGENGAGKTTLFRCIAGIEPYNGSIKADLNPLKNHLGLLLTEPFFFSKITGREYIRLLCNARNKATGNIDEKNIFQLPLDQYASTYSTGMKKKLAIAAILMQENSYFILDEPFNGVDIQSNIIIEGIIDELKALGKTIIMSSHIFSTLKATCDEVHILHSGTFTRKAEKEDFDQLEKDMKAITIGNKIDRLALK